MNSLPAIDSLVMSSYLLSEGFNNDEVSLLTVFLRFILQESNDQQQLVQSFLPPDHRLSECTSRINSVLIKLAFRVIEKVKTLKEQPWLRIDSHFPEDLKNNMLAVSRTRFILPPEIAVLSGHSAGNIECFSLACLMSLFAAREIDEELVNISTVHKKTRLSGDILDVYQHWVAQQNVTILDGMTVSRIRNISSGIDDILRSIKPLTKRQAAERFEGLNNTASGLQQSLTRLSNRIWNRFDDDEDGKSSDFVNLASASVFVILSGIEEERARAEHRLTLEFRNRFVSRNRSNPDGLTVAQFLRVVIKAVHSHYQNFGFREQGRIAIQSMTGGKDWENNPKCWKSKIAACFPKELIADVKTKIGITGLETLLQENKKSEPYWTQISSFIIEFIQGYTFEHDLLEE
jgi:hypothetical protein